MQESGVRRVQDDKIKINKNKEYCHRLFPSRGLGSSVTWLMMMIWHRLGININRLNHTLLNEF